MDGDGERLGLGSVRELLMAGDRVRLGLGSVRELSMVRDGAANFRLEAASLPSAVMNRKESHPAGRQGRLEVSAKIMFPKTFEQKPTLSFCSDSFRLMRQIGLEP